MEPPHCPEPGWDLPGSPFHEGELQVQRRLGMEAKIDTVGRRSVRRYLTAQHRVFFPLLPIAFIGSVGKRGDPAASVVMGSPGFVSAPDAHHLRIIAPPPFGDLLEANLHVGTALALLGIELPTRRRNRAIGVVEALSADGFVLAIQQTMGICQKYIQARETIFVATPPTSSPTLVRSTAVDAAAAALICRADSFFIASNNPSATDRQLGGPDVSHRGGRPGFVRVDDAQTLTAPDFVGNFIFSTLGNIAVDPRVGLLFVDFDNGGFLQVSAEAEVIWEGAELEAFDGAERLLRFHVREARRVEKALPGRFSPPDYSPFVARTGTWVDIEARLRSPVTPPSSE